MAITYKPVEGKVVLKFLDDDDDDESAKKPDPRQPTGVSATPTPERPRPQAIFALCVAAGPKVPAKAGQTLLVRPYARDGLDLGDGNVLTDGYCIVATVTIK